jgi:hypothetical protein
MALVVTVTETFSATKVILTDNTGAYNVTSNPTGYGSPNAAFADYGHYAIIRKKNVNSVADQILTLDSYDPTTVTAFTATRSVDGWCEGKKLNIPIWVGGTSYTAGSLSVGSIVSRSGIPYYCIQSHSTPSKDPATQSAYWTVIPNWTTSGLADIEANPSITVTTIGRVTAYNADVYWSAAMAANSQRGLNGFAQDDRQKSRYDLIYYHIQCVLVADQLGNNTSGEWNALTLQTLGAK